MTVCVTLIGLGFFSDRQLSDPFVGRVFYRRSACDNYEINLYSAPLGGAKEKIKKS